MSDLPKTTGGAAEQPRDEVYGVDPDFVRQVTDALEGDDGAALEALVEPLHAADFADLLEILAADDRKRLIALVGAGLEADVLPELEEAVRDDVVDLMEPDQLAAAVVELESDDALYVLEDMGEDEQREVLDAVPQAERQVLEEGLGFGEDTAGRLMQRDLIAVPAFWTIGQTIDYLRETDDLPDTFHEIYVVDPAYRPIGAVPLNRAMRTKRPAAVSEVMDPEIHQVPVTLDQEEVAYLFRQYDLVSAPVVDDGGRLVGVILVDDIVEVIQEEAEEDAFRLGGLREDDLYENVIETTRTRFSWLFLNLLTAILASAVIAFFDTSIEKLVALAILMPIVASMGGNAATQAMTVAVRAIATHELTPANSARIVVKEALVGSINGIVFAVIMGSVGWLWFADPGLGLVLGGAMVINMLLGGCAGVLVPLTMTRLNIDPAVASTVFVTTITDVFGFLSFLGLGAWLLL